MEDEQHRRRDMALRMKTFTDNNPFPPNSIGLQLAGRLGTLLSDLDRLVTDEGVSAGRAREDTATREAAREAQRENLEAFSRTARVIEHQIPGFAEKFQLPPGKNDQMLIDAGFSFAELAAPDSARFISYGMPAGFLADLENTTTALRAAISDQSSSVADRKAAGALIDANLEEIMQVRRELDAFVRNAFRDDARVLSEWNSAKHLERASRRKKDSGASGGPTTGGGTPPPPAPNP
jgi:hypothetical protein